MSTCGRQLVLCQCHLVPSTPCNILDMHENIVQCVRARRKIQDGLSAELEEVEKLHGSALDGWLHDVQVCCC